MPGTVSDSYEAGVGVARYFEGGYDDIVTFGHVLAKTVFYGSNEPMDALLAYFDKPYKWETEYQKWLELGGTLDRECVEAFETWHDSKDTPQGDDGEPK